MSSQNEAADLLGLRGAVGIPSPTFDLIACNHHITQFISPEKGHRYISQLNPTPTTLMRVLQEMREPSMLQMRGSDHLFLPALDFSFQKFKTLTSLEISGGTSLTNIPEKTISQMSQLRSLNLSHLLIETLPKGVFSDLRELRWVNLRGCSKLCYLPSTQPLRYLEGLDLSHCTALQEMEGMDVSHPNLQMLDLSCTALPRMPYIATKKLTHLFLRDAELIELDEFDSLMYRLQVIDLSGAQNVRSAFVLNRGVYLEALDISRTRIASIDFISSMRHLRHLILRECTGLVGLPEDMGRLENLEVLDISGCETLCDLPENLSNLIGLKELNLCGCSLLGALREGLFDKMSFLEKLDLSKTNINRLPSFAKLVNLRTLNISQTPVEELPDLSNLLNLREFFIVECHKLKVPPRSGEIDFIGDHLSRMENLHPTCRPEERISKPSEFVLLSTFYNKSAFDQFKQNFDALVDFISKIHENLQPKTLDTTSAPTTIRATDSETFACTANADFSATNVVSCDISSQTVSTQSRTILTDLEYIRVNIDLLDSSRIGTSVVDDLVSDLMHAVRFDSVYDFSPDSPNLSELFRTIVKLKLLVPPKQVDTLEKNEERSKKKKRKFKKRQKEKIEDDTYSEEDVDMEKPEMQYLSRLFESLTDTQKKCLVYFAFFPDSSTSLPIRDRNLIQLWYAVGCVDPQHAENAQSKTFEEIGRETSFVLIEKSFIEKSNRRLIRGPSMFTMKDYVRSFVRAQAKADGLFGFNDKNGKLTPHFCVSKSHPPSSEKLKSFKTVHTLLNVNEPMVDIRAEWFSKMRNLIVLHLGRCGYERIYNNSNNDPIVEVVDVNFLEELKNMKQLRLLSLEGFSAITKLPQSVCKLTNLKILNLRECSYLEELPVGIGSLKNLTHLDLTDCHVLHKLPRGLRFLSKLEVIKGFLIAYQIGGQQHRDACTLRDLLSLEKLRKLRLIVNAEMFPNSEDVQVLKQMKNLCNLKITWEKDYNKGADASHVDVVGQKALRHSRWKQLKCWEQQTGQHETEEQPIIIPFVKLRKLVMCCFPLETAPIWLNPSELQKLEKLYIIGGELKTLVGGTNQNTWNVQTLHLKLLRNLDMDWEELRNIFPNMTYFEKYECDRVRNCRFESTFQNNRMECWKKDEETSGVTLDDQDDM